jgi:hypothetical protein
MNDVEKEPVDFARFKQAVDEAEYQADLEEAEEAQPTTQRQEPTYAELTPAQDAFIKSIQARDFAKLLEVGKQGISGLSRDYIPGEFLPLPDPVGATHTFISLYCEVAYVRTFYSPVGLLGLTLNDFVDTNQPGMASFRAELREGFNAPSYAKFVQATLNQHTILDQKPPIISLEEARKLRPNDWKRGPKKN